MKYEPMPECYWDDENIGFFCGGGKNATGRRKEVLNNMQKAYGGEHIFRFAFLKLFEESPRMATAFGLYFGFHSGNPLTMREAAHNMGVSPERIRQLSYKCHSRLVKRRDKYWVEYGYITSEELRNSKAEYNLRKHYSKRNS